MFKSTRLLIIFLVWIISLNSYSQRIMGEAILGLNMSKVEGGSH
jgi:hypothetical protein